jgi:phosphoribosylformimino-5-aminoimidazole carboxamide ribotide isomerase
MKIYPAIDIIGGQAVRLFQGDYNKKTVYNTNPVEVSKGFEADGAGYLHVVDLDAAKSGKPENLALVKEIAESTSLKVEIGGGIRSLETAELYLYGGVDRIILGTAAVENPALLDELLLKFGANKIAVGVDAKDGFVATKGWLDVTQVKAEEFCAKLHAVGVESIIFTDISKDGAGVGTNLPLYKRLVELLPQVRFTASGGVTTLDEIRQLDEIGMDSVILGNAIYRGLIDLKEAVELEK